MAFENMVVDFSVKPDSTIASLKEEINFRKGLHSRMYTLHFKGEFWKDWPDLKARNFKQQKFSPLILLIIFRRTNHGLQTLTARLQHCFRFHNRVAWKASRTARLIYYCIVIRSSKYVLYDCFFLLQINLWTKLFLTQLIMDVVFSLHFWMRKSWIFWEILIAMWGDYSFASLLIRKKLDFWEFCWSNFYLNCPSTNPIFQSRKIHKIF